MKITSRWSIVALTLGVGLVGGRMVANLPTAGASTYLVAVPVLLGAAFVASRGPRWCLAAFVGLTVFGAYETYKISVATVEVRITDLAYLALVGWVIVLRRRGLLAPRRDIGQKQITILLAVLGFTVALVQVTHPGDFSNTFVSYLRLLVTLSLIWLVPYATPTAKDRRFMVNAVIVICGAEILYGLSEMMQSGGFTGRMAAHNGPNATGLIAVLLVLLALHAPVPQRPATRLVIATLGVVGLLTTRSVGSTAALVIAIGLYGWGALTKANAARTEPKLTLARVSILVVGGIALVGAIRPGNLPGSDDFGNSTTQHRTVVGFAGIELFLSNPVAGVGWQRSSSEEEIGSEDLNSRLRRRFDRVNPVFFPDERPTSVHNAYIQVLAEAGFLGFVAFVVVFVRVRRRVLGVVRDAKADLSEHLLARSLLIALVAILVWWNDNALYGALPETVLAATFLGMLASFRLETDTPPEPAPLGDPRRVARTGGGTGGSRALLPGGLGNGVRSASGNGGRRRAESRGRTIASALDSPPPRDPTEHKNALAGVTIALFGRFESDESRSRMIAKALRRAGASVAEVTDPRRFALRTPALLSRVVPRTVDMLLVGRAGHADVASAKAVALAKRIPVVFDPFVSLYEAWTDNRPESDSLGLRARRYLAEDELSCRLADLVLLDTNAHVDYFVRRLGVSSSKLERIWLGADDQVMYPRPQVRQGPFRLLYNGAFGRLDGVEHIVRAAALLKRAGEDVEVVLVGHGGTRRAIRELANELDVGSIRFLGPRSNDDLAVAIAESDVCLGLFGTSPRGSRVVPGRVFDALACARPVVTADTPAAREALVHGEHAWLCAAGDPASLADAISALKHDRNLRTSMAEAGYARFKQEFSVDALAADLGRVLLPLLGGRPTATEPSRTG